MKAAINSIFEQVVYNLTEYADFAKIPGFNLKKSWQTLWKKKISRYLNNRGTFKGHTSKYVLQFTDNRYVCRWECIYFLKHGVCMHLVAFSNLSNMNLFGSKKKICN